jgi:hypothetical protein
MADFHHRAYLRREDSEGNRGNSMSNHVSDQTQKKKSAHVVYCSEQQISWSVLTILFNLAIYYYFSRKYHCAITS